MTPPLSSSWDVDAAEVSVALDSRVKVRQGGSSQNREFETVDSIVWVFAKNGMADAGGR